jgi:opacity protein-like surface antigen
LDIQLAGHKVAPYAILGAGYAWADLKHPLFGSTGAFAVTVTDSNGYTANAGLGVKYYLLDNFFVDFDARYRYFSRLVNNYGQGLNTTETTVSVGYRF